MQNKDSVNHEHLDRFGKFLMENLRDKGIASCDILLEGKYKAPALLNLQNALASLNEEQRSIVRRCVVWCLDGATHDFLFKLHERADFERDIQMLVDGINVDDLSEAGMHYEPFGPDGWQARYSKFGEAPDEI